MRFEALLRSHAFMKTESPPQLWAADTDDRDFIPLLGEMIVCGLSSGTALGDLTLAASNIVVTWSLADDAGSLPPAGEYVGITVRGPGTWGSDWTWLPASAAPPGRLPIERVRASGVQYAYGRALPESSITVFLKRELAGR